jgi:SPP1 gp7 family putative phage head morphogenesis protein
VKSLIKDSATYWITHDGIPLIDEIIDLAYLIGLEKAAWMAKRFNIPLPVQNASAVAMTFPHTAIYGELGATGPFDETTLDLLKARNLTLLEGMTDDAAKAVTEQISQGMLAGEGMDKIARRIKGVNGFEETYKNRAKTIARTETAMATVSAEFNQYVEMGVEKVQFVAAISDRTCDECASLDMQVFDLKDAPIIPRHPNCRCDYIGVPEEGPEFKPFTEEEIEAYRKDSSTPRFRSPVDEIQNPVQVLEPADQAFSPAKTKGDAIKVLLSLSGADDPRYPHHIGPLGEVGAPLTRFRGRNVNQIGDFDVLIRDSKMNVDVVNVVNEVLTDVRKDFEKLDMPQIRGIAKARSSNFMDMGDGILGINKGKAKGIGRILADERKMGGGYGESAWTRDKIGIEDPPFSSTAFFDKGVDRIKSSLYHESGHHIHQMYKVTDSLSYRNPVLEKRLNQVTHDWKKASPTEYGRTNKMEWFAENYALLRMGRKELCDPEAIKIIEEVGLAV